MLNRYAADGMTYVVNEGKSGTISMQTSCQQPLVFYAASSKGPAWTNIAAASFNGWDEVNKPVWDPCPAGWRVVSQTDLTAVCQDGNNLPNRNIKNYVTRNEDGGYLLYFQQLSGGHASFSDLRVMVGIWIHLSLLEIYVRFGLEIRVQLLVIMPIQAGLILVGFLVNCLPS